VLHTALGIGLGAWALGLGLVAANQRRLIFKPPTRVRQLSPGPHARSYRIEALTTLTSDGTALQGWRSEPLTEATTGVLLYFGGRGENVVWAPHMSSYLAGWSVLAFNYRSFGASTGRASETAVMHDARSLFDFLVPAGRPVVLAGRSLGTSVALRLACEVAPQRLVLISPFPSLPHLARGHFLTAPLAPLLRHRMDALQHAKGIRCPTLVVMARGDRKVPNSQSLRLARGLSGPVTLAMIEGERHGGLPRCVATQQHLAAFALPTPPALVRVPSSV
jgi:hypothetical protein